MDALLIKPKSKKQLNMLKRLLTEMDVDSEILQVEEKTTVYEVNGIPIQKASESNQYEDMSKLITSKNLDAKELRSKSWTR